MSGGTLEAVVPAFNEEEGIVAFLAELLHVLEGVGLESFRVIVVDDHSEDSTFEKVCSIGDDRIQAVRLSRNCGSHVALRAGIGLSSADHVACLAADGQDDPHVLPAMLEKAQAGADVVWALRRSRGSESLGYRLRASLFYRLLRGFVRSQSAIDLDRADFFLLSCRAVDAIDRCPERHTSLLGLLAWLGFQQDFVEYDRPRRAHGRSRWTRDARLRLAVDWLLSFSGVPLRLITLAGFGLAGLGFVYATFIVLRRIVLDAAPSGWSSLIVAVSVLGGVQMIMLGIVGEYLWRTFEETKRRPLYFIERATGAQLEERSAALRPVGRSE